MFLYLFYYLKKYTFVLLSTLCGDLITKFGRHRHMVIILIHPNTQKILIYPVLEVAHILWLSLSIRQKPRDNEAINSSRRLSLGESRRLLQSIYSHNNLWAFLCLLYFLISYLHHHITFYSFETENFYNSFKSTIRGGIS